MNRQFKWSAGRNKAFLFVLLGIALVLVAWYAMPGPSASEDLPQHIRARLEDKDAAIVMGLKLYEADRVKAFYRANEDNPVWINGKFQDLNINTLLSYLNKAETEGLVVRDYHRNDIRHLATGISRWIKNSQDDSLAALDILITDACLSYAVDISTGMFYGNGMNVDREENLKGLQINSHLKNAIDSQKLQLWLRTLPPGNCKYTEMKQALADYRKIAASGGFADPGDSAIKLRPGARKPEVLALNKFLYQTGDIYPQTAYVSLTFDANLGLGIRNFQKRLGLHETGLVDAPTLKAMRVPVEERIIQIVASMERLRWLPPDLGQRYILVNIAGFSLQAIENYSTQLGMKIIVGKPFKQTPVFHADMKYIVINPSWNVPKSIMTEEMLPLLRKNPSYLARNHMVLYNSNGKEISPYRVNWWRVTPANFNFSIKQMPGSWNSLGAIKFLFPNPYSVYLHGTPYQYLFSKDVRAFSHGCMRMEDPIAMAVYLLKDQPGWDRTKIEKLIRSRTETTLVLKKYLPVHVTYLTAWIDGNDQLCFADDIYGRDSVFRQYLPGPPVALNM